jgi:GntR family transcriptional regulator
MNFDISPTSPIPIYRQLIEQVHRMVASGQLQPGDELPSIRAVALQYAINPMTVSKAYNALESQGWLERRRGLGMVVASPSAQASAHDTLALLRPSLIAAAQIAKQLDISEEDAISEFQLCLEQQIREQTPQGKP